VSVNDHGNENGCGYVCEDLLLRGNESANGTSCLLCDYGGAREAEAWMEDVSRVEIN
jgi:hypothetical protein